MKLLLAGILRYSTISFLFLISSHINSSAIGDSLNVQNILKQVFEKNRSIKSLSYTIIMKERVHGEIINRKTDFKVTFNPYRIYLKQFYPNQGLEILYNQKETGDKALLNRNTFALSNFRLDPLGNMMRKESHHSIFKGGFTFLLGVIENLYNKYPEAWKYEGIVKYGNIICYKINFENPSFGMTDYTIQEGENLETISDKINVSDFMIFEDNPTLNSFDDFKPGIKIKIPIDYAKQIILYIDKEKLIPVGVKVYDEKGLFEDYFYTNVEINPEFSDIDFQSSNPAYGFH